ncbi:Ig-like domain-containing protein [Nocardia terpenica]|uniref:Ig-like domain-containing protein n=1 Tax=Nocardia terpenica TaxID=455432 RepID=UPI0002E0FC91|nr:Ig-like domain-containing protein [Nocardia terpenica]
MAGIGTSLTTLKNAQRALLLKPLDAAVFLAPWYTPSPTAFTDNTATLQPLPTGYLSVGLIDKKSGVAFARNVTAAPIESYGELQPTRDDIVDDTTTLEFEPQQTNALTIALTTNAALQSIQASGINGEVLFAQPSAPQIVYYSAIVIGKDGTDSNPIYIYKVMPKVAVTKWGGENWVPTGLTSQKLTLTAFKDDVAGFAVAHGFGGAGWKALLAKTGIPYPVTSLSLSPNTLTVVHGGAPSIPITVVDQLGNPVTGTIAWTSSATATATVSNAGIVTGIAAGTATITATYTPAGGATATGTCTVTVS